MIENVLNKKETEMSEEFINALNRSGPTERLELIELFLTGCAIKSIKPQAIIDNTFCGKYKNSLTEMVNFALSLQKEVV